MGSKHFVVFNAEIDRLGAIADDAEQAAGFRITKLPVATKPEYAPHRALAESASFV
jgi:hypothetical protein